MTSQAKIESNRRNAQNSTGPKTKAGKEAVRLNALKHGLCTQDVVIPTEDADEYEAFRQGWHDDWKPCNRTRFELVERLAADAWRLRRCVRVETSRIEERGRRAIVNHNQAVAERLAQATKHLRGFSPDKGLAMLNAEREGVELLIALWEYYEEAAANPTWWHHLHDHHQAFVALLGISPNVEVNNAGPMAILSWDLLVWNSPQYRDPTDDPPTADQAAGFAAELLEFVREKLEELREHLATFPDADASEGTLRDGATADDSPEGRALMRYEGQHDRSFRANLNTLIKLVQTGADLVEEAEVETVQEVAAPVVAPTGPAPIKANPEPVAMAAAPIRANPEVPRGREKRGKARDKRAQTPPRGKRYQEALK